VRNKKQARTRADRNRRLAGCGIAVPLGAGAFVDLSEREGGETLAEVASALQRFREKEAGQ